MEKREGKDSLKTMYFPPHLITFSSIILPPPSSCVVKFDVKSSPSLSLMLLSLTMWLQEEVAISFPSAVTKPHSDASKQICDPPLPPRSPVGSEKQWAALRWNALWKAGKEREGMEENKDKTEVKQMYRVRKEKEEVGVRIVYWNWLVDTEWCKA